MTTQQRAAMAQVALINFFQEAGTVSSIMNTVHVSVQIQSFMVLLVQPLLLCCVSYKYEWGMYKAGGLCWVSMDVCVAVRASA